MTGTPSPQAPAPASTPAPPAFTGPPARRRFSPSDVLRLLVGLAVLLVGLVLAVWGRSTAGGLEADIARQAARLPSRLLDALLAVGQMMAALVPLLVLGGLLARRRFRLAAQLGLVGGLAVACVVALDAAIGHGEVGQVLREFASAEGLVSGAFPSAGYLAAATAAVTFAAPWMTRRWRRTAWTGVVILVGLRVLAGVVPAGDLLLAVGVGITIGSLGLLVFGAPNPEPSPEELCAALQRVGIQPQRVQRSSERGTRPAYHVLDAGGKWTYVKVRTPEDRDADLLNRAYRAARFRSAHLARPFASLKREVEHEALLLVMAAQVGVRVPRVVGFGLTSGESAFLAQELVEVAPGTDDALVDPITLRDVWRQVGLLQRAGIAHRHLSSRSILLDDDGSAWLADFDEAEASATDQELHRDVADLLVESALAAGVEPAVHAAVDAVGPEAVEAALPLLQPLALSAPARRRVRQDKDLLPSLRRAAQEATGATDVPLAHLERIRPRTALIIVASTIAFYALLPQLGNLGGTAEALRHANPLYLAAVLLASATTYVFATISFMGSVPRSLSIPGTLRAQVAASFATLVGPGSSGSLAVGVRFLERSGRRASEATAAVALDAIAGTVMHVLLLFGFVLWTGKSGVGRFSLPDSNIVLLALAVLATLVGLALLVRPLRQWILTPVVAAVRTALSQVGQVLRSPGRVIALLGGSAGLSLAYIAALMASVAAFGGDLAVPQVGTAYLAATAIAALAPTPGGLGAVESALIAALTGYGLADGVAVSSVLTFRLATFWLPILPGWLLFGWMQRRGEL
ncbi:MAG TPA: lysylphosphatidylglycerol synthase transmembrane domain-containing protein [Candidatus Limnocylindria bacterium]|nr:lysylphosphatidylglycerol synthase transmembrane domain-containing protein [Candidatus Limnocylindria bacterium]